jgi:hypothetical protein
MALYSLLITQGTSILEGKPVFSATITGVELKAILKAVKKMVKEGGA